MPRSALNPAWVISNNNSSRPITNKRVHVASNTNKYILVIDVNEPSLTIIIKTRHTRPTKIRHTQPGLHVVHSMLTNPIWTSILTNPTWTIIIKTRHTPPTKIRQIRECHCVFDPNTQTHKPSLGIQYKQTQPGQFWTHTKQNQNSPQRLQTQSRLTPNSQHNSTQTGHSIQINLVY